MNNSDKVGIVTPKKQKDCYYKSIKYQENHISAGDYAVLQNGNILYNGEEFEFPRRDDTIPCPEWLKDYYKRKYKVNE